MSGLPITHIFTQLETFGYTCFYADLIRGLKHENEQYSLVLDRGRKTVHPVHRELLAEWLRRSSHLDAARRDFTLAIVLRIYQCCCKYCSGNRESLTQHCKLHYDWQPPHSWSELWYSELSLDTQLFSTPLSIHSGVQRYAMRYAFRGVWNDMGDPLSLDLENRSVEAVPPFTSELVIRVVNYFNSTYERAILRKKAFRGFLLAPSSGKEELEANAMHLDEKSTIDSSATWERSVRPQRPNALKLAGSAGASKLLTLPPRSFSFAPPQNFVPALIVDGPRIQRAYRSSLTATLWSTPEADELWPINWERLRTKVHEWCMMNLFQKDYVVHF
eukprot:TRINITY_DN12_c0_g1_i1.p1 TRINITY_DN12_c0_g1~~TRINITY_DN12_c0_g1_i1.p1  ORF type:complete len:331 (+),score=0.77 TRINITY_DN12_c0_g1_i1:122-1114(+)